MTERSNTAGQNKTRSDSSWNGESLLNSTLDTAPREPSCSNRLVLLVKVVPLLSDGLNAVAQSKRCVQKYSSTATTVLNRRAVLTACCAAPAAGPIGRDRLLTLDCSKHTKPSPFFADCCRRPRRRRPLALHRCQHLSLHLKPYLEWS